MKRRKTEASQRQRALAPLRTGVYSKSETALRLRDHKVRLLVRKMRRIMPWLEASDIPACRAWAQLEVLCDFAYAYLRRLGIVNEKNEPRRLLSDYRQLRQAQAVWAAALGLTPAARMAIKATGSGAALDVIGAMAKGDAREEAETIQDADDTGGE